MRQLLHLRLTISLKNDNENWRVKVGEEVEFATASGNSQRLFALIRDGGERRTSVSEVVCSGNG